MQTNAHESPVQRRPWRHLLASLVAATVLSEARSADIVEYFPLKITTSPALGVPATTAYDLPQAGNGGYYYSRNEYGPVVELSATDPAVIRSLAFQYYSDYVSVGTLVYRIYKNDGPPKNGLPTPGTLLDEFYSDVKSVAGGGISTFSAQYGFNAKNTMPASITVTIEFIGMGAGQHAGWLVTSAAPTVGSHPSYYWERTAAGWTAKSFLPDPPPAPTVTIQRATAGQIRVSVNGKAGATHVLERSTQPGVWTAIHTNTAAAFEVTQSAGNNTAQVLFRAYSKP